MSKPIVMTEAHKEALRADFEEALKLTRMSDGKINFSKTFSVENRKATVYFTAYAWVKMVLLVKNFDKEIAWHGVASRLDGEDDGYIISDILVYPQEVTGASVEMNTEEYSVWIMENCEDERFDNIRMQGHSHVNMGVTPSSVDLNHQEEILNMLGDDDFYIFMIWNKSFQSNTKIYDLRKNILFENQDVSVQLFGSAESLEAFLQDAKDKVRSKVYTYPGSQPQSVTTQSNTTKAAPPTSQSHTPTGTKPEERPRSLIGAGWRGKKNACAQDDDEDEEFYERLYGCYGGFGY